MRRPRLGFIGIGIMGEAMTRRLLDRAWQVTAWNLERERLELVTPHGAAAAASPADVIAASDIVLMCVLDGNAVRNCVFGPAGLATSGEAEGKLLIDLSTIDPDATRDMAARAFANASLDWIDCPVSGGPTAARAGALTIMAGGEAAAFERARTVLAELGTNVTRMGPVGAGQTAKIINQAIVGVGYVLMTEAALLAEAAGIDAARLPECLAGGFADSELLRKLYPRVQRRDFEPPQAYARQLLKDMKAVGEFAHAVGCELPLVLQARDRFAQYVDSGHALSDPASLIQLYERARPANN
ncbi:MAG TPA: NAD(P)-dependent oxidoreductase [Casimicrobiaceae bacterium]|nr:NAD(P)-dependent oxidoreductase [Casimicrobiaceae bacterium]